MSIFEELAEANVHFVQQRPPRFLPLPPARKVAVVTCMDARIDPARLLGLSEGEAHVIRNAGGRARDALRSLVISQRLLGTTSIAVIHHTDCGMLTFTNEQLVAKVHAELNADASSIDFLPFSNLAASVEEDVALLQESKLLNPNTEIRGYIYDVGSGRLTPVATGASLAVGSP